MNDIDDSKLIARLGAVVLIGCAFLATRLFAAEAADPPPTAIVKYGDLNLNAPAGVAALYSRIHRAAAEVCGLDGDMRDLPSYQARKSCAAGAEARAVAQSHSAALAAFYEARQGRAKPDATMAKN
jgi:UrcA family protein